MRQRCATCHSTGPGQQNGSPPLGIIGRTAGSVKSANYSDTMRSSRITWDRQSLETFLAAPRQLVRGTRMRSASQKRRNGSRSSISSKADHWIEEKHS
ncbi:c-type cytochrome [Sinorhizobium meliloti]|uniref:c-type cytochrome n=1 Tax=Rhizobium meliloti TaxID=382 RepID=UPI003D6527CB